MLFRSVPGAICGLIAAVTASLVSKAPGKDVEALFDRAVAYKD